MNPAGEKKLFDELTQLPLEDQKKVIEFARSLISGRAKASPKSIAGFAGVIGKDDLEQMAHAIEEACEQVNPDEW